MSSKISQQKILSDLLGNVRRVADLMARPLPSPPEPPEDHLPELVEAVKKLDQNTKKNFHNLLKSLTKIRKAIEKGKK